MNSVSLALSLDLRTTSPDTTVSWGTAPKALAPCGARGAASIVICSLELAADRVATREPVGPSAAATGVPQLANAGVANKARTPIIRYPLVLRWVRPQVVPMANLHRSRSGVAHVVDRLPPTSLA